MKEYIVCGVFWFVFTLLLHIFGRVVAKGKKSESYGLITGYLIYSILTAAGGMIIQIANLPWAAFAGYIAAIWMVMVIYIIYKQKKNPVGLFRNGIGQYVKDNWIIYGILAVLTGMLFFYYKGFWLGNHLDDGYYITKVATLPYTHIGYATNFSVGVANAGFDSYILGTWELEASVYVKMLGVKPTLYLRLFQSIFYYFFFLNLVKAFAENIFEKLKITIKTSMSQYPAIIALLFGCYYIFLTETSLLPLRDMFQFNTGMFLGASLTKTMGILLLLFYYVGADKLSWKMVQGVSVISIILMSKSTIAVPLILITACSYFIVSLVLDYEKRGKIFVAVFLGFYVIMAFILPGVSATQEQVYEDVLGILHSPVIIACIFIFLCSFLLKEKVVNRLNCIMILIAALMLLPQVNDVFEVSSVYVFVSRRAFTTWVYTFVLLNSIYLCALLLKLKLNATVVKAGYAALGVVLSTVCILGFKYSGDTLMPGDSMKETNIRENLSVAIGNPHFIPNSTISLGKKLEQLSKDSNQQLYVASPEWVNIDQTTHALAVMLRTYAPDIVSVSASARYPVNNGSALENYDQQTYARFAADPNEENTVVFEEAADEAGVNCIVVQSDNCAERLIEMGYELYGLTEDQVYYVWYRL